MKISIITPTYNSASTVRDTLDSILRQTFKDIEYIVIDCISTDGTVDILREYEGLFDGKMRWVSEKDNGLYDAMNKGIRLATGDIVGILNSDDVYYDENVLAEIARVFSNNSSIDCVYGDLVYVDPENTETIVRQWNGSLYRNGSFEKGWHPAHPTFYTRRQCYEQLGGYDLSLAISADFELMLRFLGKHKLRSKYIRRNFVRMRAGGTSTASMRNIITGNRNVLCALRKNGYKVNPPIYLVRRWSPKLWDLIKHKLHLR